jgi:hypothetical protein
MIIRPDDIDDRTVPLPASHVAIVDVDDDGGVLVDEEAGRGYPVNATASLIWKVLDSVSPIGEIIDDVSSTFGAPPSDVAASVHGLVRTFGQLGLLDNVSRDPASIPIDIEYVDLDACGEPVPPGANDGVASDERYLTAPPNA